MAPSDPTFEIFPDLNALFERPTLDAWRTAAEKSLRGQPLEKLSVRTHEGMTIDPLFTAADRTSDPGLPGSPPHVRGRTALGAGPAGWSVCQAVTHPDPEQAASIAADEFNRGVDAVWLRFDASVRSADEEIGPHRGDGVRIANSRDLDPFFAHLDLSEHGIHLDAGSSTPSVAAAWLAAARRHEVNPHDLRGSLAFDPIGALAADGVATVGLDGGLAMLAELVSWTSVRAPNLKAIGVGSIVYHMAGANAVQELAYSMATAVAYLRALSDRGVQPDTACDQLIFTFAIGDDLFVEAAKLRACRRLWSRITEACGVSGEHRGAVIHAVASPRRMATRDPWVNSLRTTVGSFAAVVGGADLITVLPFDSAIGEPDELGRRIAANSQTILAEESHLERVIDPGGGSWYLEHLTDALADSAWRAFQDIEASGGMASALTNGSVAADLEKVRSARRNAIATGGDPLTGVSSFPNLSEESVTRQRPSQPPVSQSDSATEELARLLAAANAPSGDGAVVEAAMAAATAGAGIGRLTTALRGTRDRQTLDPLPRHRDPEIFERLRDASDVELEANGARPRIFLANMGPVPEHKPRASFAANFFESGGIEAIRNNGFDTVEAAVDAFAEADTRMAVICSSDARYAEVASELAAALESAGARTVLVAGKPGEQESAWREAGVTGFIHLGCNRHQILVDLLQEEGVLHV